MEEIEIVDIPVPIENELEEYIATAFTLFDTGGNKTIEVRDVGTVVRALGCCPTEAELEAIVEDIKDPQWPGCIHLSKFLPYVAQFITDHKYEPATPTQLLDAFQALDPDGHGYITKDYLSTLLKEESEQFTQEEVDEMLELALDPYTQTIRYEQYIDKVIPKPPDETNVYKMADEIEARKAPPPPPPQTFSEMMAAMQSLTD